MGVIDYIEEQEKSDFNFKLITEQKTGAEIAKELGITRQAISNILKRSMEKVYKEARKVDTTWGPFETATAMSIMFNVEDQEINKFFRLFPPKIRKEIEDDAKKVMPKKFK